MNVGRARSAGLVFLIGALLAIATAARASELDAPRREALIQRQQIGAIRAERIFRQAPFHPYRLEKTID